MPWRWAEWADQPAAQLAEEAWDQGAQSHGPPCDRRGSPPPVATALDVGRRLESAARLLGSQSWPYLATLATLGGIDLTLARAVEPHLDAVAILHQAGSPDLAAIGVDGQSTFGVYAANAPGTGLDLTPGDEVDRLDGIKPWCSLAGEVTHALVTASAGDEPVLCAVPLQHKGAQVEQGPWVARGLAAVTTATLSLEGVPAVRIGPPGFYLDRPGFAWGGIGVAAVWLGGAAAVAGRLARGRPGREPDQVALAHLGQVDLALHTALVTLRDAATAIDAGRAEGRAGQVLGARVRGIVAAVAEEVLGTVGHALGPSPLVHDEEHARRVADLTVYIRQHHAERDHAALGALLTAGVEP